MASDGGPSQAAAGGCVGVLGATPLVRGPVARRRLRTGRGEDVRLADPGGHRAGCVSITDAGRGLFNTKVSPASGRGPRLCLIGSRTTSDGAETLFAYGPGLEVSTDGGRSRRSLAAGTGSAARPHRVRLRAAARPGTRLEAARCLRSRLAGKHTLARGGQAVCAWPCVPYGPAAVRVSQRLCRSAHQDSVLRGRAARWPGPPTAG